MEDDLSQGLEARFTLRRSDDFTVDIDLKVPAGQTAALLGPNGSGKTTVVSVLAGLLAVDSGRVTIDGVVADDPAEGVFVPSESRHVGVVFQNYLLFPHMPVVENVAFGLRSAGISRSAAIAQSMETLERMGLGDLSKRRPAELSGGQAQRVALARALVSQPGILLLDEPMSALDVSTRSEVRHTLAEHLAEFPGPRLLVTHDPAEAFLLADEIHIMEGGSMTQSGDADEILLRPLTPYVADLVGVNLVRGVASEGRVRVGDHLVHVAEEVPEGPVLVTIHPSAIAIHAHRPDGSPRNAWETTVARIEPLGIRSRLRTSAPLPLTAELTSGSVQELGLAVGDTIWLSIKATEVSVQADTR